MLICSKYIYFFNLCICFVDFNINYLVEWICWNCGGRRWTCHKIKMWRDARLTYFAWFEIGYLISVVHSKGQKDYFSQFLIFINPPTKVQKSHCVISSRRFKFWLNYNYHALIIEHVSSPTDAPFFFKDWLLTGKSIIVWFLSFNGNPS